MLLVIITINININIIINIIIYITLLYYILCCYIIMQREDAWRAGEQGRAIRAVKRVPHAQRSI